MTNHPPHCACCNRLSTKNACIPIETDADGYSTKIRMTLDWDGPYVKILCSACAGVFGLPSYQEFKKACES